MIVLATGLYWISIGLLCLAGSALIAHVLRRRGHQERGVWALGLLGALVLPLGVPLLEGRATDAAVGGLVGPATVLNLEPIAVGVSGSPLFEWLGPTLLSAWAGLSALLLIRLVAAVRTIRRIRNRATRTRVAGGSVRVSRRHGPAVIGILRPVVLIPEWVLDLPARRREWILRHEEEHIRGRDPWLLGFVLLARVAVPWNPVVWWLGWSIQSAIETDCDRRTVGLRGDVRGYGEALLSVAAGPRPDDDVLPAMAPAFAEQHVPLKHRIEAVTTPQRRVGGLLRLGLASVAVLVTGAACEMPAPTAVEESVEVISTPQADVTEDATPAASGPNEIETVSQQTEDAQEDDRPVFIPYDTPPRLTNATAVQQVLSNEYPPLLKASGIGGEVIVWFYISEDGDVLQSRVREDPPGSSGYDPLDDAALRVADAMTFEPATNRGEPTAVWVQFPITFTVGN